METLVVSAFPTFQRPDPEFWHGKRVLITGHTGFKGGWLTLWLARLGAEVTGIGLVPNSNPNLFELANIEGLTKDSHIQDIRDAAKVRGLVAEARPEIVMHLAAQPLVLPSYENPLCTFMTNIQGTANLLDALRIPEPPRLAVMITTDKVYENHEIGYPFRETDRLGGRDPYSASKAASEIVIASYRDSFLREEGVTVASARAGNVIGGGDWSMHRLIPDAVRAWEAGEPLLVRRPQARRPWQHVLEPLCGYLCLAERLWTDPTLAGAFNFGPESHDAAPVHEVIDRSREAYGGGEVQWGDSKGALEEAGWLSLEVSKARQILGVVPRWGLETAVFRTMDWYRRLSHGADAKILCSEDILAFEAATPAAGKFS
ncbi:MAG: CDP-glucose 4,6-dehydratase [Minwuia sp.]|uniref:CDP-glucose 4,6-dehydratase n=1 Tax=Minwuia sp. TaxID=2493630 RepID=UPI003A896148